MAETKQSYGGFTAEEREAMKDRADELKTEAKRTPRSKKTDGAKDVLDRIAEMTGTDRVIAERIAQLVAEHAPGLTPKTWYGMPGWAKNGKIVVFFQPAAKFKARYATLGFNDTAAIDDGTMWATSFAITELTPEHGAKIAELVARAEGSSVE